MSRRLLSLIICGLIIFYARAVQAEENFLLIDGITSETVLELGPHVEERISPCSTFKIALSLMGYDAGILIDETNPTWDFQDGYDDWLVSWRAPLTPKSWMHYSCVWYSKVLSLRLGPEKIQSYLTSMEYGNKDMSGGLPEPGPADPAWIDFSLTISPRQQVDFIQRMILAKLPISPIRYPNDKSASIQGRIAGRVEIVWKNGTGKPRNMDGLSGGSKKTITFFLSPTSPVNEK